MIHEGPEHAECGSPAFQWVCSPGLPLLTLLQCYGLPPPRPADLHPPSNAVHPSPLHLLHLIMLQHLCTAFAEVAADLYDIENNNLKMLTNMCDMHRLSWLQQLDSQDSCSGEAEEEKKMNARLVLLYCIS